MFDRSSQKFHKLVKGVQHINSRSYASSRRAIRRLATRYQRGGRLDTPSGRMCWRKMLPIIAAENRCFQQRSRHQERGDIKVLEFNEGKAAPMSHHEKQRKPFSNDMKGCFFCLQASSWLTGYAKLRPLRQGRDTFPLPEASITTFLTCFLSHLLSYSTFL